MDQGLESLVRNQCLTSGLAQFRQSRVRAAQASFQRFGMEIAAVALAPAEVGHPHGEGNRGGFRRGLGVRRAARAAGDAFAAPTGARGHARAAPSEGLAGNARAGLVCAAATAAAARADREAVDTSSCCSVGLRRQRALEVVDHFFFPSSVAFGALPVLGNKHTRSYGNHNEIFFKGTFLCLLFRQERVYTAQ